MLGQFSDTPLLRTIFGQFCLTSRTSDGLGQIFSETGTTNEKVRHIKNLRGAHYLRVCRAPVCPATEGTMARDPSLFVDDAFFPCICVDSYT